MSRVRLRARTLGLGAAGFSGGAGGGGLARFAAADGTGGTGTFSAVAATSGATFAAAVLNPDDTNLQTLPNWIGAVSGELNTGHKIWFPPSATKLYIWNGGTTADPTTVFNAVNATMKANMVSGKIPWGAIVYPNKNDPDDNVESWGVNAADLSFDNEDMVVYDIPAMVRQLTGIEATPANTCCLGFSEGGFITLRYRAKFGTAFAKVFVVVDAPRLNADLGGSRYNDFSAAEKAKLWNNTESVFQAQAPFSSATNTGLFDVLGAGTGALLMIRSDPGGGAPATNAAAMNDAGTRLTSRGVTFSALNADDGDDTPSHVLAQFMTAWNNATDVDGGGVTMDLGWIGVKFNG